MEIPGPPLSLQDDEKRIVVGVYKCPPQSQTWDRVGKGFASLKFEPTTGMVFLFALAPTGTETLCRVPLTASVQLFHSEESSLEWQESGMAPRMAFSFQDPALCNELFTKATNVIQAEKMMWDPSGRKFWHSTSGFSTQIEWAVFINRIVGWFSALEKGDMNGLKTCLQITPEQQLVTLQNFAAFLSWFGKMEEALPRMRSILAQPWFQGFASRQEAEQRLHQQNTPGAFLVRFSSSQVGCFALSYLDYGRAVKHVLIQPAEGSEGYTLACADGVPLRYRTLIELINTEKEHFATPPATPSQPRVSVSTYDLKSSTRSPTMKVAVYAMAPQSESWSLMLPGGYVSHYYDGPRRCHVVQVDPEAPAGAQQQLLFEIQHDTAVQCDNAQTVTWQDRDGRRIGLSFVYSEGATDIWTKLSSAKKPVTVEQQAEEVFTTQRWPSGSAVPFDDFITGLRSLCHDQAFDELVTFIRYIVFYNRGEDDRVSMEDLTRLLAWFGPCAELVSRLRQVVQEPWFHWFVTREQAEQMLRDMPEGTFLVRFGADKRSFALSYVEKYGDDLGFTHALLPRTYRNGGSHFTFTTIGGRELQFATLPELVQLESTRLRFACPRLETA